MRGFKKKIPSYQIGDCPKFKKGKVGAEALITHRQIGEDLAYAVVEQAVRDWRWLCEGNFDDWDCNFDELTDFFKREASFYIGECAAKRLWEQMRRERRWSGF